jgi:hypothetical protein
VEHITGFDLSDPNLILVPLRGDAVVAGSERLDCLDQQLANRLATFGAPAIGQEDPHVRRIQRSHRIYVSTIERIQQPLDR